jgi:STIP1 family protein 1
LHRRQRQSSNEEWLIQQESELHAHLTRLTTVEPERECPQLYPGNQEGGENGSHMEAQQACIEAKHDKSTAGRDELFSQVNKKGKKRAIPEYQCGKTAAGSLHHTQWCHL